MRKANQAHCSPADQISFPQQLDLAICRYVLQKKLASEQKAAAGANLRRAIDTAVATAAAAAAAGDTDCVLRIDVGLDVAAVREAVATVNSQQKVWLWCS